MKACLWASRQDGQAKGPLVHVAGNARWCRHHRNSMESVHVIQSCPAEYWSGQPSPSPSGKRFFEGQNLLKSDAVVVTQLL